MSFKLIFSKDGILQVIHAGSQMPLPLKFLQEEHITKDNDLAFLARWWDTNASFEEGTTIASFLSCLEPWQNFLQDYLCKDIPAYITESKKPRIVEIHQSGEQPIDWINLFYKTEIKPAFSFEHRNIKEDINAWFNSDKKIKFNGYWSLESHYDLVGYSRGVVENYGIEHTPLNELANIQLTLDNKHLIYAEEYIINRYLGENYKLFNPNAIGLRHINEENRHHFDYVLGEKFHNLKDIINAFFLKFSYTPVLRDEFTEFLKERLGEIEGLAPDDETLKSEQKGNLKIKTKPKPYNLAEQFEEEKEYWTKSIEKYMTKQEKDDIVRIGGFKKAKPLEERILSSLVTEEDLSTPFIDELK